MKKILCPIYKLYDYDFYCDFLMNLLLMNFTRNDIIIALLLTVRRYLDMFVLCIRAFFYCTRTDSKPEPYFTQYIKCVRQTVDMCDIDFSLSR